MTADSTTQQDFEQERPPMPGEMTVLEHLRELRNRVVISVIVVVLGVVVSLVFWETILGWLLAPARADPDLVGPNGEEFRVSSFSPLDRIGVAFKIGLYGGLMIASPVIVYQLLAFIHPALSGREKKVLYSGLIP